MVKIDSAELFMDFPSASDSGIQLPFQARAVAFDMDGTLLDYDGRLSDSVVRAVQLIARTGIRVFLISGRLESGCAGYWERLGLDTPISSCNGARIAFPGETPILDLRLSDEARKIVLDIDRKYNLYVNYYVENAVHSLHDGPERDNYSRQFSHVAVLPGPEDILALPPPSKCLCITAETEQPLYIDLLTRALDDIATVTTSNERFIEIIPPAANKGNALAELARWSGIPVDRFIAVGDGMNDKPMLERAGFAISFKSGDPRLADLVDMLLPPLWEDGMEILAKCILGLTNSGRFLTQRSSRFFKK